MTGVVRQFLATISCNFLSAAYGSAAAWTGPNFLLLTSDKAPFESGALSKEEASLVVSMPCFGAIIGTVLYSMLINRFSRKALLVSIAIPEILSWVIILMATNVYHLYAARLIMGIFGSATFTVIPVYVSEIASDKVRGTLGSMLILTTNAGCLFGFAISLFLNYSEQIKINIMIPIVFLVLFHFFPDTPEFLLKTNQKEAYKNSLKFFRGSEVDDSEEMVKMNVPSKEPEKDLDKIESEDTSLSLADFCSPAAKKAILIALFLGAMNQFCGAFTLVSYANKVFKDAGTELSEDALSVIIGVVQLLANVTAMLLVERAGRKILVTISSTGAALGLIGMGVYDVYKFQLDEYRWIPIVTFSMTIFMASIGMLPLTFVLLSELLPKKIKNVVTLCALEVIWVLAFILVTLYPTLVDMLGTQNIEFIFASCCILGTIFYLAVLPETSGKSYEEIMRALEK